MGVGVSVGGEVGVMVAVGVIVGVGVGVATTGAICPMLLADCSVNQMFVSGPLVMPKGWLLAVFAVNGVNVPDVVMRPTWFELVSVNHKLPSAPVAISLGRVVPAGRGNSLVTEPVVVMRPMWLP